MRSRKSGGWVCVERIKRLNARIESQRSRVIRHSECNHSRLRRDISRSDAGTVCQRGRQRLIRVGAGSIRFRTPRTSWGKKITTQLGRCASITRPSERLAHRGVGDIWNSIVPVSKEESSGLSGKVHATSSGLCTVSRADTNATRHTKWAAPRITTITSPPHTLSSHHYLNAKKTATPFYQLMIAVHF
jgi:hypothetical protein